MSEALRETKDAIKQKKNILFIERIEFKKFEKLKMRALGKWQASRDTSKSESLVRGGKLNHSFLWLYMSHYPAMLFLKCFTKLQQARTASLMLQPIIIP